MSPSSLNVSGIGRPVTDRRSSASTRSRNDSETSSSLQVQGAAHPDDPSVLEVGAAAGQDAAATASRSVGMAMGSWPRCGPPSPEVIALM
jgi:hypothetical protein